MHVHVEEMILHNARSSAGFNITLKREGEKREEKNKLHVLQQGVFIFGHPSKYYM